MPWWWSNPNSSSSIGISKTSPLKNFPCTSSQMLIMFTGDHLYRPLQNHSQKVQILVQTLRAFSKLADGGGRVYMGVYNMNTTWGWATLITIHNYEPLFLSEGLESWYHKQKGTKENDNKFLHLRLETFRVKEENEAKRQGTDWPRQLHHSAHRRPTKWDVHASQAGSRTTSAPWPFIPTLFLASLLQVSQHGA